MMIIRVSVLALLLLLLAGCAKKPSSADPMASKVDALVDAATRASTEAEAFVALESLGPDAVPYLVSHLGDTRPLPVTEIALNNQATDAFEGMRHYQPKVVHDALSALLNQLTGASFGFVYNGASDAQRKADLVQWVNWCVKKYPQKATVCRNGQS